MKIAYLSCSSILSSAPNAQNHIELHRHMMASLSPAFEAKAMRLYEVAWDDPMAQWPDFDAAIIGTTWDYWDRQEAFLQTLEKIQTQTRLFNPAKLVRWNSQKTYLKDLAAKGAKTLPTLWLDEAGEDQAKAAFDHFQTDELVFKRQVGAGAVDQHRLKRGEPIPAMVHPMMAQPFMPTIKSEGELSFILIDGTLSHALIKRAASNDYRIQPAYGGVMEQIEPSKEDMDAALATFSFLDGTPLYARIDMLRDESGTLMLMEAELIEPYLYPLQGPNVGEHLAAAISKKLS